MLRTIAHKGAAAALATLATQAALAASLGGPLRLADEGSFFVVDTPGRAGHAAQRAEVAAVGGA